MFTNDMARKINASMDKVKKAIEKGNGHTILSTGITGDDARMAKAVVDAGVTMLEPNHPALALAAEQVRHGITVAQMAEVTQGVRNVVGKDIYITVGIPGGFTEILPTPLTDDDFLMMARAGADGLHTHKSSLYDLEELVKKAHKYGLCVDAYIGLPTDLHTFGIPAEKPEETARLARQMEEIGTDMIGLMTGMSYEGLEAGQIPTILKERLCAMVEAVKVPTLAEGGINMDNFRAFKETGVNILVIGTASDGMAGKAVAAAAAEFLNI